METAEAITERLEHCFSKIEEERMQGIPILNTALRVSAIGTREWQGHWLCVLLTPWFMNIMLLPCQAETDEAQASIRAGVKRSFPFPAGKFEFIRGGEEFIGPHWMCSLFSPVLQFADQDTAEAAAQAALEALLGDAEDATEKEQEMAMIWKGDLPESGVASNAKVGAGVPAKAPAANTGSQKRANLNRRTFLGGKAREAGS